MSEPEPLTLPCGLTILARRLTPEQWGAKGKHLPTLIGRIQMARVRKKSPSEALADVTSLYEVIEEIVVQPRMRLDPTGEDEINILSVSGYDFAFILRWAAMVYPGPLSAPTSIN